MKAAPVLLLAAAAVCFTLVIADEFSSGELYRNASSLRTDESGASVWFEALAKLPGVRTERNYAPLEGLTRRSFSSQYPRVSWATRTSPTPLTLSQKREVGSSSP